MLLEKLPRKWCVKVTEDNVKLLSDWRTSGSLGTVRRGYVLYPNQKVKGFWVPIIPKGVVEISTDDFIYFVLEKK